MRRPARQRGTATVEGVIVLPVLILLFYGVLYLGNLAVARADANSDARRCSWSYSMNNCNAVPEGCGEPEGNGDKASAPPPAFSDAYDQQKLGSTGTIAKPVHSVLGSAMEEAFGAARTATARRTLARPPLFGGGAVVLTGTYRLPCNLKPKTSPDLASEVWKILGL